MLEKFLKVAKLIMGRPIVDVDGRPTADFIRSYNDNIENIKNMVNAIATQVTDIEAALGAAGIAVLTANQVQAQTALASSYTSPDAILSAQVNGAKTHAEIIIAAHTRKYGDGSEAAVGGGTLTDLLPSTSYYIYYEDPERAGGAVTYYASTNYLNAAQVGGVHSCGLIQTPPLTASEPISGGGTYPPGIPHWKWEQIYGEPPV